MDLVGLAVAFAAWISSSVHVGVATRFSAHGDPWNPRPFLACLRRDLDDSRDMLVAHPTLPCRSEVVVCIPRTGRCRRAVVGDRGPRRAAIDLSPRLSRELRHNGMEVAIFFSTVNRRETLLVSDR